jgi:translocation and assembly module TamA
MVDEALTAVTRLWRGMMKRFAPLLPAAAFCVALGAPVSARADSPVELEGGDEAMREAILDLLPDRDPPQSLFDAERIAEEAAARALVWLRSDGYYAAQATAEARENPPLARVQIAPGPRFVFAAPELSFLGAAPAAPAINAAREALNGLRENAPARAASVLAAEAGALEALKQAGYADAEAAERRVVVDHASGRVQAELRFDVGAPVGLGALRAQPEGLFRAGFIEDLRNWELGETYTPQALSRLRRDLSSTGAVSRIDTDLAPPDANGLRDVVLDVEPARRNAYELGFGYSTTEGAALEAEWTRRNFSGRADSLTVAATLGQIQQELSATLARPHAAGLGHTVNFGATLDREETDAFSRQGATLFASVDALPRLRRSRSYGVALNADSFDDLAGGVTDAIVLSSFLDLRQDSTGFTLDPRGGAIWDLRLEPAVATGEATLGFVRFIGETRHYESLGDGERLTLAGRTRIGWLEAVSGDVNDVPPDRRFYAGGGGSVRGFEYNSIYPRERDLAGLAPGGQGSLEASLEARWRFGERLGAAFFVDAGSAFDDWSDAGELSWGAGIGARYDLGFAALRVDIAFPIERGPAPEGADYALYISIGQAF